VLKNSKLVFLENNRKWFKPTGFGLVILGKKPVQTDMLGFFRFGFCLAQFFLVWFGFFGFRLIKPKPNRSIFLKILIGFFSRFSFFGYFFYFSPFNLFFGFFLTSRESIYFLLLWCINIKKYYFNIFKNKKIILRNMVYCLYSLHLFVPLVIKKKKKKHLTLDQ